MSDDQLEKGPNFACFHAGPKEEWMQYREERPAVPISMNGKHFLRSVLDLEGAEMSLNAAPPGRGMPFLHRHQENRELYIVVGGRGQFIVDGEVIDVQEGSIVRMEPAAARSWRNNSDALLQFICIQYRADSVVTGGTMDGKLVEGKPAWPEGASS